MSSDVQKVQNWFEKFLWFKFSISVVMLMEVSLDIYEIKNSPKELQDPKTHSMSEWHWSKWDQ